jgi:hypothetical protein
MVDLELMSTSMKKKGSGTQSAKKKAATKKKEDSMDKTKVRKKKATFTEPDKAGKKEDVKEVEACNRCFVGFSIRVDKGNKQKEDSTRRSQRDWHFYENTLTRQHVFFQAGRIHG